MHIALGRTENDAVPNHLPPPLQLIFRFNNNNRPETRERRTETFSSPAKAASELIKRNTLPAGWLTSSAALHTRLNFALFQKCHFHLAVLASPLARRVLHSRKTPATFPNFITFPSQRGNPTRLCHRYRLYRERYIF